MQKKKRKNDANNDTRDRVGMTIYGIPVFAGKSRAWKINDIRVSQITTLPVDKNNRLGH